MYSLDEVKAVDMEVAQAIEEEVARQNSLAHPVFGCNQLDVVALTGQFQFTRIKHFFVIVYKFIKKVHFFSPLEGTVKKD